jgi:hypothetical protein
MRNVELNFDADELTDLCEVGPDKIERALGYLSTWGFSRFPLVRILRDREKTDFIAHYFNEDGNWGYTIGAVWHGDHYGFHS